MSITLSERDEQARLDAPVVAAPEPGDRRRRRRADAAERSVISDSDRKRRRVRVPLTIVQVLILIGLLIAGLGPLLWLLKAAISPTQDTLREPLAFIPSDVVQWHNLAIAWNQGHIGYYLGNTAILACGAMIANLAVTTRMVGEGHGFRASRSQPPGTRGAQAGLEPAQGGRLAELMRPGRRTSATALGFGDAGSRRRQPSRGTPGRPRFSVGVSVAGRG